MSIEALVALPSGHTATFHEVQRVEIQYPPDQDPVVSVFVQSWASEGNRKASIAADWGWVIPGPHSEARFTLADLADIDTALVTKAGSPFNGGDVVDILQPSIDRARKAKDAQIYQAFTELNESPLTTPFGTFWTDDYSAFKITQVGAMAMALHLSNKPVSIDFKDVNNAPVTLDFPKAVGLGLLMGQREQELRVILNELREDLADAETVEEINAIYWPGQTPPPAPAEPDPVPPASAPVPTPTPTPLPPAP